MDPASILFSVGLYQQLAEQDIRRQRVFRDKTNPFECHETHFVQIFRLSKPAAWCVIQEIREIITSQCKRKRTISPEQKVLCALHFFGSGSYQRYTANDGYVGLSQSSVSRCISEVAQAINQVMLRNWVKFPLNQRQLQDIKTKFSNYFGFPGVIGVIDCTHVSIIAPKEDEDFQSFVYINRKGFHSINVQLICDADMTIMNVNAKFPGSTHDAFIWRHSGVRNALQTHHETGSWFLGDAGYPLEPWLLTPVPNPAPGSPSERYNKAFIKTRNTIERCNGVLKSRFRCCLRARQLTYSPEKAGLIINACAVLHNICQKFNVPDVQLEEEDEVPWGPIPSFHNSERLRVAGVRVRDSLIATRF